MRNVFTDTVYIYRNSEEMKQYIFRDNLYKRMDIMMQYICVEKDRSLDSIYRKEGISTKCL